MSSPWLTNLSAVLFRRPPTHRGTLSVAGLKKVPSARSEALVVQFSCQHVKVALLPVL